MKIDITGVDMKVSDELREHIEKKLDKFQRYFDDDTSCTVKLRPAKDQVRVELTLKIHRDIYRAEAKAKQAEIALDAAVDTMEGQIHKHKAKMKKRRHQYAYLQPYFEASDDVPDLDESQLPSIVKSKRFTLVPMEKEEAAIQMEMMSHDFHIFLNAETGKICALYKRDDGNYGLLEPDY